MRVQPTKLRVISYESSSIIRLDKKNVHSNIKYIKYELTGEGTMQEKNEDLIKQLIDKSIEAFILGLEVYNKPTLKYRVEGFSFFICNAWELMLKAELLKRGISIYYKDSAERTLSISDVLSKIYSDKHTRIRLNLEKIIDLRNISTHFITEDYEAKYIGLFQACAINYTTELDRFHSKDITEYMPYNFLTINARYEPLSNEEINLKYPTEIAEMLIKQANEIEVLSKEYDSSKFFIDIRQNLYITRKKGEADFTIQIDKNSKNKSAIIKELKDPADTHKYSFNNVIRVVDERIKKKHLKLDYKKGFNSHVLSLIINFYNIKEDEKYSYKHTVGNSEYYTYSEQFIDFILQRIKENPRNFVESLKSKKR